MPNIGWPELVIVLVVALLVFGPRKLPDIGRSLGKGIREFRQATAGLRDELDLTGGDEPAKPVAVETTSDAPAPPVAVATTDAPPAAVAVETSDAPAAAAAAVETSDAPAAVVAVETTGDGDATPAAVEDTHGAADEGAPSALQAAALDFVPPPTNDPEAEAASQAADGIDAQGNAAADAAVTPPEEPADEAPAEAPDGTSGGRGA